MIARLVRVRGRVQGVGFRWHTAGRARSLGVRGWVRNESDGSVTAHLEGDRASVGAMLDWIGRGPAAARVESIVVDEVRPSGATSFDVVR